MFLTVVVEGVIYENREGRSGWIGVLGILVVEGKCR
jgi:hypothetical protein